jgi:hypothetical protein
MKTLMTDYFYSRFSRPPGSSSRGAQANPDAIDPEDDDDAPIAQRERYV